MDAWERAWESQWRVNFASPARLMKRAVRHLVAMGGGVLVTKSFWAARRRADRRAAPRGGRRALLHRGAKRRAHRDERDAAAIAGGEEKVTAGLAMGEWVPPAELGKFVAFLATGRVRHLSNANNDVNSACYQGRPDQRRGAPPSPSIQAPPARRRLRPLGRVPSVPRRSVPAPYVPFRPMGPPIPAIGPTTTPSLRRTAACLPVGAACCPDFEHRTAMRASAMCGSAPPWPWQRPRSVDVDARPG